MSFIPFLPRFHDVIKLGVKTMTCRTRKYGEPGDMLDTNLGVRIQILEVRRMRLGDVAKRHWREEGCESPEEFVAVWEGIHPRRDFDPDQLVWLHVFRYVGAKPSYIVGA